MAQSPSQQQQSLKWRTLNNPLSPLPQDLKNPFTLTASPSTDLWRSNERTNRQNAPAYISIIASSKFRSLRATISLTRPSFQTKDTSADTGAAARKPFWTHLYDQAGILLYWPCSPNNGSGSGGMDKWIKAGIELVDGKPRVSVVTCDRYSDWSLHSEVDVVSSSSTSPTSREVVVEAIRDGETLWIVVDGVKVREPKFAFIEGRRDDEEQELWVGVAVARPAGEGGELEVGFRGVEVVVGE